MIQKLYNFITWLNKNCTSICLMFVVLTSVHPFFTNNHGHNYYTFIGIVLTFMSTIFTRWHVKDGIKESNFYNILCIIVMALGVTAIFFISGKKETTPYTDFELFITTYFGATLGLVFGTLTNDLINGERKQRELNKKLSQIPQVTKLNWIDITKKFPTENKEYLCKNSKGAYFVGYIRVEDVGHGKMMYECNSGDEGMGNVTHYLELSEIEKTIPEELITK